MDTFSQSIITRLHDKAELYLGETPKYQEIISFYRNKPLDYWQTQENGLMKTYIKDLNGHKENPINGKLSGLFFSTKLLNGKFPKKSPFGDYRFEVPIRSLYLSDFNIYFCDFYCNGSSSDVHYITLVMTKSQSESDLYCEQHLCKLHNEGNPFFCKITTGLNRGFIVANQFNLWIEVFYTEDVHLNCGKIEFTQWPTFSKSRKYGVPNNLNCRFCNIKA